MPVPAANEEEAEDDLQIHSEGGAAELGAVSDARPSPPRPGEARWGAGAPGPFVTSPSLLSFPGGRKEVFFGVLSSPPGRTLSLPRPFPAKRVSLLSQGLAPLGGVSRARVPYGFGCFGSFTPHCPGY